MNRRKYITIALFSLYFIVLIRTAWLSDDAYISFRTAYNFVNGYGLTFNPSHRVQTFTNPLWTFLIATAYFLTSEIYYTSIFVSILVSLGAFGGLWKLSKTEENFWLGATILILSAAYVDYSTSGLENPLVHLLLAVFAYILLTEEDVQRRLFRISLVGSFLMTTRMDATLLVTPAVLLTTAHLIDTNDLRSTLSQSVKWMGLGGTPFLAWKAFALFYYGFPFPNTYYAKTNVTKSHFELLQQGYYYLVSTFQHDLVLALGLIAGVSYAAVKANRRLQALATGGMLYFFYILYVGGDFMIGRFYTPILFIAVIVLVRTVEIPAKPQEQFSSVTTVVLLLLVLSVALPGSPMLLQTIASGAEYSDTNINNAHV